MSRAPMSLYVAQGERGLLKVGISKAASLRRESYAARQTAEDCMDDGVLEQARKASFRVYADGGLKRNDLHERLSAAARETWRKRKSVHPVIPHMAREFIAWPVAPALAQQATA